MLKYEQKVVEERRVLAIRFSQDEKEIVRELDAAAADALAREFALQATLVGEGGLAAVQVGRDFVLVQPGVAASIAKALTVGKLRLEEIEQAERIAFDAAILARTGAPIGLTNDPKIQDMARVERDHNRTLRRFIPSIQSGEVFGTPTVITRPNKAKPH